MVASFLTTLATTGLMQGDIADYYQGQTEPASGLPRANDAGYPYAGKPYEASPLSRVIETGAPGQEYAIIGTDAPNTVKYQYAGSVSGDIPDIPPDAAGQYLVETHISPSNNDTVPTVSGKRIKDQSGSLVLTPGQRHEAVVFEQLMEAGAVKRRGPGRLKRRPHRVVGDKGYSSGQIRHYARQHGIRIPIPRKRNEGRTGPFDRALCRLRNRIERLINRCK
jgi:Transposase DDE domain